MLYQALELDSYLFSNLQPLYHRHVHYRSNKMFSTSTNNAKILYS